MDSEAATGTRGRRRFTVEEYDRMAETGILATDERVELIEGEIIEMIPTSPRHAACVSALIQRLLEGVGDRAVSSPQHPVRLQSDTEPHPDVTLLRPPEARYFEHTAEPGDASLVVEVSDDASYDYDRHIKLSLYARAVVREVWIVDLTRDVVEVFLQPGPTGYTKEQRVERGGTIAPVAFPDVIVTVEEILPPADTA